MARATKRRKVRPQQLDVHKTREAVAADAVRRFCPDETHCSIELKPWEKTHRGLHSVGNLHQWNMRKRSRDAYDRAGMTSHRDWPDEGPWMWGKIGQPFRLGDIADLKDAALGRVIFTHCNPEDIDAYERTINALQHGRSIVGA